MDPARLSELLQNVRSGRLSIIKAMARLRQLPFEDLGFAKVDHHRGVRQGFPEVVLGEGKEPKQIAAIVRAMQRKRSNILVTRLARDKMAQVMKSVRGLKYHAAARAATWSARPVPILGKGAVLVVCAGTSDIPVAEEAAVTATMMGNRVERLFDVGVAGIHRLLE